MVRYDVKGKSNLTDAFGIEGEEGRRRGESGQVGRRSYWVGSSATWSVVAPGVFRRKLVSATTGNRIKEIPRALRRQITCTFGDNYRFRNSIARGRRSNLSAVNPDRSINTSMREDPN